MLKVHKLYPAKNCRYERIYFTRYAARQIQKFFEVIKASGQSLRSYIIQHGYTNNTLQRIKNGYSVPSLPLYLDILEETKAKHLEREINYAYAHVLYSRREIQRRISRLKLPFEPWDDPFLPYGTMAKMMGIKDVHALKYSLNYEGTRSLYMFADGMYFIAEQEKLRGFKDRLNFYC